MEKLQKRFNNLDELLEFANNELDPEHGISIIESKQFFYLEDAPAFVRNFETLRYEGSVSQINI